MLEDPEMNDWYLKIIELRILDKMTEKHIKDSDIYVSKADEFWFLIVNY